jgi:hypothetical protein
MRSILEAVSQPLQSMVLLGINCGFGQTDVANLPRASLDLDTGWVDFPRPKTGIERRSRQAHLAAGTVRAGTRLRVAPHRSTSLLLERRGRRTADRGPLRKCGRPFSPNVRDCC